MENWRERLFQLFAMRYPLGASPNALVEIDREISAVLDALAPLPVWRKGPPHVVPSHYGLYADLDGGLWLHDHTADRWAKIPAQQEK